MLMNAWDSSGQVFLVLSPGFPAASRSLGFWKVSWGGEGWGREGNV